MQCGIEENGKRSSWRTFSGALCSAILGLRWQFVEDSTRVGAAVPGDMAFCYMSRRVWQSFCSMQMPKIHCHLRVLGEQPRSQEKLLWIFKEPNSFLFTKMPSELLTRTSCWGDPPPGWANTERSKPRSPRCQCSWWWRCQNSAQAPPGRFVESPRQKLATSAGKSLQSEQRNSRTKPILCLNGFDRVTKLDFLCVT